MERVFVPWWILFLAAALFAGLALASALSGSWVGVLAGLVLGAACVRFGLLYRARLQRLENSNR